MHRFLGGSSKEAGIWYLRGKALKGLLPTPFPFFQPLLPFAGGNRPESRGFFYR